MAILSAEKDDGDDAGKVRDFIAELRRDYRMMMEALLAAADGIGSPIAAQQMISPRPWHRNEPVA